LPFVGAALTLWERKRFHMIAYEVHLNGKVLTIAGGPDVCVLSVTLAAVGSWGSFQQMSPPDPTLQAACCRS